MGRFIFNGVTVLSLLVCLATAVLWVRGIWTVDLLVHNGAGSVWTLRLGSAEASVEREPIAGLRSSPLAWTSYPAELAEIELWAEDYDRRRTTAIVDDWRHCGVSFHLEHHTWLGVLTSDAGRIGISYWLIVLLTLILPVSRLRFRKRHPPGLCPNCHYDLRATPDRCPECGTAVPEASSGKAQK